MAKKHSKKAEVKAAEANKATQLKEFFEESQVEIKKVVWPSRKETVTTSIAVLALVVVMSLFLGFVDLGLTKLVEYILS
ncbi:preprotein translocase subunit SecE [Halodesulfovibrio marinisediminis]|uniref:Protein translocase subunit SecE n=1 Tax=Halodesulfovibrio marinisediminis DSM 17456 TaxID=1121457 RepID=A0A1N6H1C0_9BACT|nr:preprotein translocase subunit SecE [Halodesulfovibrio marinisediminis]SIO13477.1 protein translocase subunit secE/sec61 gamma [Halodesulfovibrio marinisediminis DSM 17456]